MVKEHVGRSLIRMIVQYFLKEETRLKQNLICRYNETVKSIFVIAESMYVTTSQIEKKNQKQIKHNNWR